MARVDGRLGRQQEASKDIACPLVSVVDFDSNDTRTAGWTTIRQAMGAAAVTCPPHLPTSIVDSDASLSLILTTCAISVTP